MKNSILPATLSLLAFTLAVHGQVFGPVNILNSSFESSSNSDGLFDTVINDWFMENHPTVTTAETAQRRNTNNMPVVPDGSQWANLVHSGSTAAGIYQAIDIFAANWEYTISLTVSQRSNQPFNGVTVALYAGDVIGANTTNLVALGATLLDSAVVSQSVFSAAGVAESFVVPAFTLSTGIDSSLAGETLWLRVFTNGEGHHLIDNINVTAIPEPSTFAALIGLLAFGVVVVRRRFR
ncbi:MAG: PEP-CTERM sorting domain-containing protein [Verrucomicrobia bacterium]|nr:PEP-CTERM sorting domain-containing protein [Verrucomicrobiota bacterium]